MGFILWCILSNVIADFVFQTDNLVKKKNNKEFFIKLKAHIKHGIILFLCMLPIILVYKNTGFIVLIISVLHIFLDISKSFILSKIKISKITDITIFIVDQIFHISIIIIGYMLILPKLNVYFSKLLILHRNYTTNSENIILYIICVIYVVLGGSILVSKLTNDLKPENENKYSTNQENTSRGNIIGILERTIIFILLTLKSYGAVGFVIAAKSLTRFKKIEENKEFAEYYLIGTLSSSLVALLGYIMYSGIKQIINI